jgi:hypothetical protein
VPPQSPFALHSTQTSSGERQTRLRPKVHWLSAVHCTQTLFAVSQCGSWKLAQSRSAEQLRTHWFDELHFWFVSQLLSVRHSTHWWADEQYGTVRPHWLSLVQATQV